MSFFCGDENFLVHFCEEGKPVSPIGRSDFYDNTAEVDDGRPVEVLEGPEVEINSYEIWESESEDMEEDKQSGETSKAPAIPFPDAASGSDIYEVEQILDGPKRRKEHLNKICYKVRWKGYGPEEDTWQPLSDLLYVQDMIDEYRAEKNKLIKMRKKNALQEKQAENEMELEEMPSTPDSAPVNPAEEVVDGVQKPWHPVYGFMKDTFWKDLELGRHVHNLEFFGGDMYSKVKGSRRAAHAEAVANIQKQQQTSATPKGSQLSPKSPKPPVPKLSAGRSPRSGSTVSKSKSNAVTVSSSGSSKSQLSPKSPKLVQRNRKRGGNPFSARGYISSKRRRRSYETAKSSSPRNDTRQSTVTSETVGIVTTSEPLFSDCAAESSKDLSESNLDQSLDVNSEVEDVEVFAKPKEPPQMTVSSETMLIVTTESIRLEEDVIKPEAIFTLSADNMFQPTSSSKEDVESPWIDSVVKDVGWDMDASTTPQPPTSSPSKEENAQRSTLDTQSEASGSVERTHDEECLWGGACNRSDCKSNRRWNMKNGKGTEEKSSSSRTESDSTATTSSSERMSCSTEASSSYSETTSSSSCSSSRRHQSQSSTAVPSSSTTNTKSSNNCGGNKQTTEGSSSQHSGGQTRRSLFSSKSCSSDSSVDEGPTVSLNKDAVFDTFGRMDALAHRMHMDTLASSYGRGGSYSSAGHTTNSSGNKRSSSLSDTQERPGLFSDTFSILSRDSGVPSCESSSETASYPSSSLSGGPLSANDSSSFLSSPGKENFRSLPGTADSSSAQPGSGRTSGRSTHTSMEVSSSDSVTSTSSISVVDSGRHSHSANGQDGWPARKRIGETGQPLEKIPSPNSRRGSDLDSRISTLTCDELEDFPVQGEEQFGSKNVVFVTNADLLQAVNLGKAEVVKRAISQCASSQHRLDFEQPDNTGLTLLMKAVQKGNLAMVEMLLDKGVKVNAQQTNGMTALMMAAEQNGVCLVALLLKHGANSSLYTVNGDYEETALLKAIKRQHREVVSLMLRVGVNIAAPTCSSPSAVQLALERRNPQIESLVRTHIEKLTMAFESRVLTTLEGTAQLLEQLFPLQCFPLRESNEFLIKFNSNLQPVPSGEGFLLFIAHTKINDKGVRCRFHGNCPISSVYLNGVQQSPLTKDVNFVTSCHPIIPGCNTLVIKKLQDYTSKAKLLVCAYRAKLIC